MTTPIERILDQLEWEKIKLDEIPSTDLSYVTHQGVIELPIENNVIKIKVYQLSNGIRVLDQNDLNELFGDFEDKE